jgi:hypothetical protein
VFGRFSENLVFRLQSGGARELPLIWLNYPDYEASNIAIISHEDDANLQIPEFTGRKDDRALQLLVDYLNFFGYNRHNGKDKNLSTFMIKVPFMRFYNESIKEFHEDPMASYRRFG